MDYGNLPMSRPGKKFVPFHKPTKKFTYPVWKPNSLQQGEQRKFTLLKGARWEMAKAQEYVPYQVKQAQFVFQVKEAGSGNIFTIMVDSESGLAKGMAANGVQEGMDFIIEKGEPYQTRFQDENGNPKMANAYNVYLPGPTGPAPAAAPQTPVAPVQPAPQQPSGQDEFAAAQAPYDGPIEDIPM